MDEGVEVGQQQRKMSSLRELPPLHPTEEQQRRASRRPPPVYEEAEDDF